MSQTVVGWGDPKAIKRWAGKLAVDVNKDSYFTRKFIGTDENSLIQQKTELEGDSGDKITFDLSVQLRGKPVTGDARLEGKEENLRFYSDEIYIDQMRHAVSAGGRMTRKRTAHDLRGLAKRRLTDYWAAYIDQMIFVYLSGARGINEDFFEDTDWTGFADNPIQAPDSQHQAYGGAATGKATLTATDKMSVAAIEKVIVRARMLQSLNPESANMKPVTVDGENRYILLMSAFQEYDLRTGSAANEWLDIQKALATAVGNKSKICTGGLGMINNTVLHSHERVIRFADYGAGSNLPAARALFMGRQAGLIAYGSKKGLRFDWQEEQKDYKSEPTVACGIIAGIKKSRFNGQDFGSIALDTYAKDPNAA
jgi:N4-gp56 family major capsid protein